VKCLTNEDGIKIVNCSNNNFKTDCLSKQHFISNAAIEVLGIFGLIMH
jgi:hypothetical protein